MTVHLQTRVPVQKPIRVRVHTHTRETATQVPVQRLENKNIGFTKNELIDAHDGRAGVSLTCLVFAVWAWLRIDYIHCFELSRTGSEYPACPCTKRFGHTWKKRGVSEVS